MIPMLPDSAGADAAFEALIVSRKYLNKKVKGTTVPRIKFGTDVATVDLRLVPNCSAAMVTNNAQYPMPKPTAKHAI